MDLEIQFSKHLHFAQEKTLFGAIGVCSGEIKKKEFSRICDHFDVLISHKEIV